MFRDQPVVPLLVVLAALIVAFVLLNPEANIRGFLAAQVRTAIPLAILAGCQTLVMLTGGIDLSVAATGSMAGFVLARVIFPSLLARIPAELPRQGEIALDWAVFAVISITTIGLSLVVALVPAIVAQRAGVQPLLRQQGADPARQRMLDGLVAVQFALAIVLGAGASLMLRSLWNLQHVDPGFEPDHVLTFRLQTTSTHQSLRSGVGYLRQVNERIAAMPSAF